MIGVGIIGAGWWAGEHARAVVAVPGLRLAAFASRTPERIATFQREFGVAGESDYRRLLERPDIDAVAVATPHDTHARIAIEALDAGKHVLLEKPMARDRASGDFALAEGVVEWDAGPYAGVRLRRRILWRDAYCALRQRMVSAIGHTDLSDDSPRLLARSPSVLGAMTPTGYNGTLPNAGGEVAGR